MDLKPFSPKQKECIAHAVRDDETMCLAGGSIRSGKTLAADYGFALWSAKMGRGYDHALVGYSTETIMRNAGFPLMDIYRDLGFAPKLDRSYGTRIVVADDLRIWVIGSNDSRSERRIKGATFKGMLADEITLIDEDFFVQAWGRLSVDGAKLWGSFNPDHPGHWLKRKVVDRIDTYRGRVLHFGLRDNPTLSDDTIARYEDSFTGHWKKRLIDGVWAGASGLIYPSWRTAPSVQEFDSYKEWPRLVLSLDWGLSGVFCALAIRAKGKKAVVDSELYYDARGDDGLTRTEDQHLEALMEWVTPHNPPRGTIIYLDPSTPNSFKRKLRSRGFSVRNADNDVTAGLATTAVMLERGELTISPGCVNLIQEISTYEWSKSASEKGQDQPMKKNDHGCDALRYFAHTTGKIYHLTNTNPTAASDAFDALVPVGALNDYAHS